MAYKDRLREAGLVISGQSPDGELTEFVELPREVHPFYVATQAHPEFKSRPTKPHPLFAGLVRGRAGSPVRTLTIQYCADCGATRFSCGTVCFPGMALDDERFRSVSVRHPRELSHIRLGMIFRADTSVFPLIPLVLRMEAIRMKEAARSDGRDDATVARADGRRRG